MGKLGTTALARALPALAAGTLLTACAGDIASTSASPTGQTTPTADALATTKTTAATEVSQPTQMGSTTEAPISETTSSDPSSGPARCDEAALRDAIGSSQAVAPELVYEVTHLECAEGFGWAVISADSELATVLFAGSGAGIEVLALGSSICATEAGIPAEIAAQLAPDDRPYDDCA